jgi:hypothetical protein
MFDQRVRGTIVLFGGTLSVVGKKELAIRGPGAQSLAIRSGDAISIILVSKGASLSISGLSFKGSKINNQSFSTNEGTLTLTSTTISVDV